MIDPYDDALLLSVADAAAVREAAASDADYIRNDAERVAEITIEDAANFEQSSRDRADALVADATRNAQDAVDRARREVDELEAVSAQLRTGLAAAGQWLITSSRAQLGDAPVLNLGTLEHELQQVTGERPLDQPSFGH